jgi:SP family sugar:H+ symporter-like MFS transporter
MVGFLKVYGYEDPSSPIGWSISPSVQSILGSFPLLGGFIGAWLCGPMGTIFNRRHALMISAGGTATAVIIMMATTNFGALYFSRILVGIAVNHSQLTVSGGANTCLSTFAQLYIAEVAPAQFRGVMFGFISWWQSFGVLIGSIVTNSTESIPTKQCYLIPLGLCLIIPGLLIIILPFFPESPRCYPPFHFPI